ncbi:solute carrier family 25 member 45 isoform X2 [Hetaerina americana]
MLFPLLSAGILNSVFFGVYGTALRQLPRFTQEKSSNYDSNSKRPPYSVMEIFLCGCIGGFAQVFITCPVDLIKIKMQTETGKNAKLEGRHGQHFKGSFECLRKIYNDNGIKGCYRGLGITLIRDIPSSGLYFLVYEKILSWFHPGNHHETFEFFSTVCSGGIAGMISWAAILPLDVIKSRMQADDIKKPVYSGIFDCFKKSLHSNGWGIFGRGFWVMCLRAFPVNAVSFLSYEGIMCNVCRPYA